MPVERLVGATGKWEYMAIPIDGGADKRIKDLNKLGQEGWELVSVDFAYAYLKRPCS